MTGWPRPRRWSLSAAGALWFLPAALLGASRGPEWMSLLGLLGALLSVLALLVSLPQRSPFGYPGWAVLGLIFNTGLAAVGAGFQTAFLDPPRSVRVPAPSVPYEDPSGAFRLKIPAGWSAEPDSRTAGGASVRITPPLRNRVSGIAEIVVLVHPLKDTGGNLTSAFNRLMGWMKVVNVRKGKEENGPLVIRPERVTLPDGNPGLLVRIHAKRWWIPLQENILYAARPGRFLCMITCSGLAAHVPAYEALLINLYESISTGNVVG